jgi:DNA (cytosine-5)-methyltransferase 1
VGGEHKITSVEHNQHIAYLYHKRFHKDKIIIGDAYQYLENHYKKFDFIWASPPCQSHTRMCAFPRYRKRLPDLRLYSLIIFLDRFFDGFWAVENVIPYYTPLIHQTAIVDRHYIWSNYPIEDRRFEKPRGNIKDLPLSTLCEFLKVDMKLIETFIPKNWPNHDYKRQILRNCVLPEAGKYILDQIVNKKQSNLEKFLEVAK